MACRIAYSILITVLATSLAVGQDKLTFTNSKFTFHILGNLNEKNFDGFLRIDKVHILDSKSEEEIQTIETEINFENPNNYELLEFFDIDYDGNEDFILIAGNGQYSDLLYDFYIFDPIYKEFRKWEKDINNGQNVINVRPVFDKENRTITTFWHNTNTYQKTSVFKFEDGDYQLIEEFNQEPKGDGEDRYVLVTRKKRIQMEFRLVEMDTIYLRD